MQHWNCKCTLFWMMFLSVFFVLPSWKREPLIPEEDIKRNHEVTDATPWFLSYVILHATDDSSFFPLIYLFQCTIIKSVIKNQGNQHNRNAYQICTIYRICSLKRQVLLLSQIKSIIPTSIYIERSGKNRGGLRKLICYRIKYFACIRYHMKYCA